MKLFVFFGKIFVQHKDCGYPDPVFMFACLQGRQRMKKRIPPAAAATFALYKRDVGIFVLGCCNFRPTKGMLQHSPYTRGMLQYSPYNSGCCNFRTTKGMLQHSPYTRGILEYSSQDVATFALQKGCCNRVGARGTPVIIWAPASHI